MLCDAQDIRLRPKKAAGYDAFTTLDTFPWFQRSYSTCAFSHCNHS